MEKQDKKTQMNIMLDGKARSHLAELQRILSARTGMKVSQGQAIAFALNQVLEDFSARREQARLI